MNIRLSFCLIVSVLTLGYLSAQTGSVSPYSFVGLGEQNFRGTQLARMMGGLDVFSDSIHVNLNNPAGYSELKYTTYSLGINYNTNIISSASSNITLSGASLDYLSVAIPTKFFGFGFGLIPLTSVGYKIEDRNEIGQDVFVNRFEGSGGTNQVYFSVGFPFTKYLRLGATSFYNFGTLEYSRSQYLEGVDLATFSDQSTQISGLSYRLSANAIIPLFKDLEFRVLYSLQPGKDLKSQNRQVFYTQSVSENTLADVYEDDLSTRNLDVTTKLLPGHTRIGLGLGKPNKWFFGGQINLINSSKIEGLFPVRDNVQYEDAQQWIVGGFYIPDYSSITNYFGRITYRIGFRSENSGFLIENQSLRSNVLSFGLGLPIRGLSNANIGLELGQQGTRKLGLVSQSSVSLRLGLSLNDLWFVKRKYN